MGARVIQVIEVEETRGDGTKDDPVRCVMVYYTLDGERLFERAPAFWPPLSHFKAGGG